MREIRLSGSVRGVRRNPYPYRDNIHPMRSMAPAPARYSAEITAAFSAAIGVVMALG
jgi:hypothetical protein